MTEQSLSARAAARPASFSFWLQALMMLASGALLAAAFPPTGWWFCFLALAPLFYWVARSTTVRDAFGLGFAFGVGFFALHIFWLPNSLSSPDLFGPVGWLIYPPIVLIEGVFWGIVTGGSRLLGRRTAGTILLLPAFWLLMEWARTQGPLAFPWGSLGYLWLGTPAAQGADLAGSYGLSLLTLVAVALLAAALLARGWRKLIPALVALALVAGFWSYGLVRLQESAPPPDQQALLVQGNTDPLGRAQGTSDDLTVYTELTAERVAQTPVGLVIWPEGAVLSEPLEGFPGEETRARVQESAGNASVITGAGVWESAPQGYRSFNAVYGLSQGRITGRYDKVYLVPFGEGIPFASTFEPLYRVVYGWFGLGSTGRTAGGEIIPVVTPELSAAVYICYESVFPQVARKMVAGGAEVLVNISNDAWFGRGGGAEQHFQMGTLRAIETRRYLLRVGNDGVTAVVDPYGRVLERLERHVPDTLVGDYALMTGLSPYVRYGDWLVWVVTIYAVLSAILLRLRREEWRV